jgi:hypothetical protein
MNRTAIETLERRLKVTRDALAGEEDRVRNATAAATAAGERVTELQHIVTDLEAALDELRGWTPPPAAGPLDVPCPSCGAKAGEPCVSPTGQAVEPHATRGAPA